MKKYFFYILFFLVVISDNSFSQNAYRFEGQVKGLKDSTCMLAYYYGDKQFAKDTAEIDEEGRFVFSGDETLDHGMYMVVLPDGNYFEMIVTEDRFSFTTSLDNLIGNMKFSNSNENEKFYGYMQFISQKQKALKVQLKKENVSEKEAKVLIYRLKKWAKL